MSGYIRIIHDRNNKERARNIKELEKIFHQTLEIAPALMIPITHLGPTLSPIYHTLKIYKNDPEFKYICFFEDDLFVRDHMKEYLRNNTFGNYLDSLLNRMPSTWEHINLTPMQFGNLQVIQLAQDDNGNDISDIAYTPNGIIFTAACNIVSKRVVPYCIKFIQHLCDFYTRNGVELQLDVENLSNLDDIIQVILDSCNHKNEFESKSSINPRFPNDFLPIDIMLSGWSPIFQTIVFENVIGGLSLEKHPYLPKSNNSYFPLINIPFIADNRFTSTHDSYDAVNNIEDSYGYRCIAIFERAYEWLKTHRTFYARDQIQVNEDGTQIIWRDGKEFNKQSISYDDYKKMTIAFGAISGIFLVIIIILSVYIAKYKRK